MSAEGFLFCGQKFSYARRIRGVPMTNKEKIDCLARGEMLSKQQLSQLLDTYTRDERLYAAKKARAMADQYYGKKIYFRGLIEFTNYCKNNCYYCGIQASNRNIQRYRMDPATIYECCEWGYRAGFRTFVLQGGEDPYFTDERITELVSTIRQRYPDCAITLSIGEKSRESYQKYFDAGANRYLLRHETACPGHYQKLHPPGQSFDNRMRCLRDLKEIGYQTGCGMMVGSPYQTSEELADDLIFIREFQPQMVGIGPFIPHHDTRFRDFPAGTVEDTLFLLSLIRFLQPQVLLPATTALGTIVPDGREQGILAGANVVMPNISPADLRKNYMLYDNKIGTGDDASESQKRLRDSIGKIGYEVVTDRGDYPEQAKQA